MTAPKSSATRQSIFELQAETTALLQKKRLLVAENKLCAGAKNDAQRNSILSKFNGDPVEILKAAGPVSPLTKAAYRRRAGTLWMKNRLAEPAAIWNLAAERSSSKSSWYACKAAVQYFLIDELTHKKRQIDRWLNANPRVVPDAEVAGFAREAARLGLALAATPTGTAPVKFPRKGGRRSPNSKSKSIRNRPDDWRELVSAELPDDYRMAYLLQCMTGCRPVELVRKTGVTVILTAAGELMVSTLGAKLSQYAGQPRRDMLFSAHSGVAKALIEHMQKLNLSVDAPYHSVSFLRDTKSNEEAAVSRYREAVSRAGKCAFPNARSKHHLTAYSVRHQFMADMRAAELSREVIAKAMGHRTIKSAVYYGPRRQGRTGGVVPMQVKATHAIKSRSAPPLSRPAPVKKVKAQTQSATPTRRRNVRSSKP